MLIQFRVANSRSFRDPQEIDLTRSKQASKPVLARKISRVAAVYGANASGKSSLVKALRFLKDAVADSFRRWDADEPIPLIPFFLNLTSHREPSEFEIEFLANDGIRYQYGFVMTDDAVLAEWLFSYRTSHRSKIFEREANRIVFGTTFRGSRAELRTALDKQPKALSLSVGGQIQAEAILPAYDWIRRSLRIYDARAFEVEHSHVINRITNDPSYKTALQRFLSRADLGVSDIDVYEEPVPEAPGRINSDESVEETASDATSLSRRPRKRLHLSHASEDRGKPVYLPFRWESDGTRALVSFASIAVEALEEGRTLVVDEIDSSLHPLLVRELVNLFQDERSNAPSAQMLFTTHDVSLLGRSPNGDRLLERDQIWVIEKDEHGSSSVVGLSEYRMPREVENLERSYLSGRFGGVPQLTLTSASSPSTWGD